MYRPLEHGLTIKPSTIQGLGVFTTEALVKSFDLGITHISNARAGYNFPNNTIRTPLGGFLNHSEAPNCMIEKEGDIWYLLTLEAISSDTELTVKYFKDFLSW